MRRPFRLRELPCKAFRFAHRGATTMAYANAFLVIMVAFVIATALVPFLRNVTPKAPPPDAH